MSVHDEFLSNGKQEVGFHFNWENWNIVASTLGSVLLEQVSRLLYSLLYLEQASLPLFRSSASLPSVAWAY